LSTTTTVLAQPMQSKLPGLDGFGAATPALRELRLQALAAAPADPRNAGRYRCGSRQGAERESLVGIIDIELRPCFHHRQVAHCASQVLIAQLGLNSGSDEHVACVRNLQQRRGSVDSLQGISASLVVSPTVAIREIARLRRRAPRSRPARSLRGIRAKLGIQESCSNRAAAARAARTNS
jgi:hypothetical protein